MNFTVAAAQKKKDVDGKHGPMQVITLRFTDGTDAEWFTKASTPLPRPGSQLEGTLEDSQYGKKFKRSQNGAGGFSRSPRDSARIERQHSQEMALRAIEIYKPAFGNGEGLKEQIQHWTDYFVADLDNSPNGADVGGGQVGNTPASPAADVSAVPQASSGGEKAAAGATGFASDKQQAFVERLLEEAQVRSNSVIPYLQSLPMAQCRAAIDMLADKGTRDATARRLEAAAEGWAADQSDVPADTRDLPAANADRIGGDNEDIPF